MKTECIADKIELHVRHTLDSIWRYEEVDEIDESIKNDAIELCKNIRGETFYLGRHPRSVAGAICLHASMINGSMVTSNEIAKALGTSTAGIFGVHRLLKRWIVKNS
jgi:transcription initiation factor TFIIIB Brf1 subunit/transcription initiation factor TFIIB